MKYCRGLLFLLAVSLAFPLFARTWVDQKGRRLEADLVGFVGKDRVRLVRNSDKQEFTVKISTLSAADQEFVKILKSQDDDSLKLPDTESDDVSTDTTPSPESGLERLAAKAGLETDLLFIGLLVGLAVLNIPIFLLLGKAMFGDLNGFMDCIKFWLTPDIFSLFNGEYWQDQLATMKLGFYIVLCIACVGLEFFALIKVFS